MRIRKKEKDEVKKSIEQLARDAERAKADVYHPPGEHKSKSQYELDSEFLHECSHVERGLVQKIEKGEYVDLHNCYRSKRSYMTMKRYN